MASQRVDVLLYGHDGRGLGHISKSIAVGLALLRLDPRLSVMLVTGAKAAQALIGDEPLDWIKLPSYEVLERQGQSIEVAGINNLGTDDLVAIRAGLLRDLIERLRPRCALTDYYPCGKCYELEPALDASTQHGTQWFLGVRTFPGKDDDVWNPRSIAGYKRYRQPMLWYSDPVTASTHEIEALAAYYQADYRAVGYVSRALELDYRQHIPLPRLAPEGIAVFSFMSDAGLQILEYLAEYLTAHAAEYWEFYLGAGYYEERSQLVDRLLKLPNCHLRPISPDYLGALRVAKVAVVFAGYNTITDLLWAGTPCVVLMRNTTDIEQPDNARLLQNQLGNAAITLNEQTERETLIAAIHTQKVQKRSQTQQANLNGAEASARIILDTLRETV